MRVVSGEYRGRTLKAPKGRETRPTTDRIKEACISRIRSAYGDLEGAIVFDAFAGSGALGIELLSRGADYCLFADMSHAALTCVNDNLKTIGVDPSRFTVAKCDSLKQLPRRASAPYDVVVLDPPYAYEPSSILDCLLTWYSSAVVSHDAVICYELANAQSEALYSEAQRVGMQIVSEKAYGDTRICLMRKDGE